MKRTDRVLLRPPCTNPGPNSKTLPREVVLVWDQLSVAPEIKKNAKRILKQHLCFVKRLKGLLEEKLLHWAELVAILCKHALLILAVSLNAILNNKHQDCQKKIRICFVFLFIFFFVDLNLSTFRLSTDAHANHYFPHTNNELF